MEFLLVMVYLIFAGIPLGLAFYSGYLLGEKLARIEAHLEQREASG